MRRVYFIKPKGMAGPIKIGSSVSACRRRADLERWSPVPLEIVAELDGSYETEMRFHARFAKLQERGEWFTATRDLLAVIAEVAAGTFDVDSLPPPRRLPRKMEQRGRINSPEQRLQRSYSIRLAHRRRCSGFEPRFEERSVVKKGLASLADQFLAAPHIHGDPTPGREGTRDYWLQRFGSESSAA